MNLIFVFVNILHALVCYFASVECSTTVDIAPLKLPDDYNRLVSKSYFVDKSELLYTFFNEREDWLRCGSQFFYYITCPRGFGKTTNLRMIQHFARIESDEFGNRIAKQNTSAYRIFEQMKIAKIPNFIDQHLAEYPVIYLDLNFTPEELHNETVSIEALFKKVQQCYLEYNWLKPYIRNLTLGSAMHRILRGEYDKNTIRRSIHDLAAILYEYFNKEVVLLIDDFDSAARNAISNGIRHVDLKTLYFLLHEILDKAHHYTSSAKQAIIAGITSVNFRTVVYDHRIVEHCSFLEDHRFSPHFGFDDNDVDIIAGKCNCSTNERDNLNKYYKGYKISNLNRRIYSPLSISQYFLNREQSTSETKPLPKAYCINDEDLWFISKFSKATLFRRRIISLLRNGTFRSAVPIKQYPPRMFFRFIQLRDADYEGIRNDDVNGFLAYLFECGFLSHNDTRFIYEFPNVEIGQYFKTKIQHMNIFTNATFSPATVRRFARAVTYPSSSLMESEESWEDDEDGDDDDGDDYDLANSTDDEDDGSSFADEMSSKERKRDADTKEALKKSSVSSSTNGTTVTPHRRNRYHFKFIGPGHRESKLRTLRTLTKFGGSTTTTRSRAGLRALNWYEAMLTT